MFILSHLRWMLPVAMGRSFSGSVASCDTLCTSGFVDDVMFLEDTPTTKWVCPLLVWRGRPSVRLLNEIVTGVHSSVADVGRPDTLLASSVSGGCVLYFRESGVFL